MRILLLIAVSAAMIAFPAHAVATVQLPRASVEWVSGFGAGNSHFTVAESSSVVTRTVGPGITVSLPSWRLTGTTPPEHLVNTTAHGISLSPALIAQNLSRYWTPDSLAPHGAIVTVGRIQHHVQGPWAQWSYGWGTDTIFAGLNPWASGGQFTPHGGGGTDIAAVRNEHPHSLATRHWGNSTVPALRVPPTGPRTPSAEWITVHTWVRSGSDVTVRRTTLQIGRGAGHGAVSMHSESTMTWTAFVAAPLTFASVGISSPGRITWYQVDANNTVRRPTISSATGRYTAKADGIWAVGSTNHTDTVLSLHGGAHSVAAWTVPGIDQHIIQPWTVPAATPEEIPWESADPLAVLLEDAGSAGTWIAAALRRLTQPVADLLDDLLWWFRIGEQLS